MKVLACSGEWTEVAGQWQCDTQITPVDASAFVTSATLSDVDAGALMSGILVMFAIAFAFREVVSMMRKK